MFQRHRLLGSSRDAALVAMVALMLPAAPHAALSQTVPPGEDRNMLAPLRPVTGSTGLTNPLQAPARGRSDSNGNGGRANPARPGGPVRDNPYPPGINPVRKLPPGHGNDLTPPGVTVIGGEVIDSATATSSTTGRWHGGRPYYPYYPYRPGYSYYWWQTPVYAYPAYPQQPANPTIIYNIVNTSTNTGSDTSAERKTEVATPVPTTTPKPQPSDAPALKVTPVSTNAAAAPAEPAETNDYYLNRITPPKERPEALNTAIDDIETAFRNGDAAVLERYVPTKDTLLIESQERNIRSIKGADYLDVTREAFKQMKTTWFVLDSVKSGADGAWTASGLHIVRDEDGKDKPYRVSFLLREKAGKWLLAAITVTAKSDKK